MLGNTEMRAKVYMSNISPRWPFADQEALLENARVAGYTDLDIWKDELSVNERRAHKIETLTERHILFRGSTRKDGGMLIFPTLASVAWTADDLVVVLTRAAELNMRVWVLDRDLKIPARGARAEWRKAAEAFRESRQRDQSLDRGQAGGRKSAEVRAARLKAGIDAARPFWGLEKPSVAQLAKDNGVSVSGLVAALGPRKIAQANHQAAEKRKARKKQVA
jgi:hypothetical protein